jgi:general secretion pathway protein K
MKNISRPKTQDSRFSNEEGVALIAVLWVFIFLSVVAFDFTASVREEGMTANRFLEETDGYFLAMTGFEKGVYELLGQYSKAMAGASHSVDLIDGEWREMNAGEGFYRVRMVDEWGKVNLNRANEETLRRIFANLDIEEPRRTILVDSILDWRDEDRLHRLNGAEDDYYLSLSPSYTARNGPFDLVDDLLWVRGMTHELFYGTKEEGIERVGLKDIFTVDSQQEKVNLLTASAEVIHVLTGVSQQKSRSFTEERKKVSRKILPDLLGLLGLNMAEGPGRQFIINNPSVIMIEAAGYYPGLVSRHQIKGVVRFEVDGSGFELIRWVDRDTDISYWGKL